MAPTIGVFAALVCLACLSLSLTAVVHTRRKNLALSTLSIGLLFLNGFNFINLFIWFRPSDRDWWNGHILCDIEVKLYLGIGQSVIGITASIFRQLANILDSSKAVPAVSSSQRRQQLLFDMCLVFVLPVIIMCFHYLVQPNRYALGRFSGCRITWDSSWLSVVLLWMWYPLTCSVCLYYAFLTLLRLIQHHRQVGAILQNSRSGTTKSRFWRLLALSSILLVFLTPATAYFFIFNVSRGIGSRYSWAIIHSPGWSNHVVKDNVSDGIAADRWAHVVAGILVSLFFGTGKDATAAYQQILSKMPCLDLRMTQRRLMLLWKSDRREIPS